MGLHRYVRAVRAEEPPVDLVLKPPALLKHDLHRVQRVRIEGKVADFTALHGRLRVAVEALEGEGMRPGMVSCSFL